MSSDVLARAFEPFYTTKPLGKGTGLGLSVVKGVLEQQGGTVHATSQPGAGTTVTCVLPASEVQARRPTPQPQPAAVKVGQEVLVIDDEEAVRQLAVYVLEDAGYRARAAHSGQVGLDAVDAQRPDLVLLDLSMPEMDGWTVLERLSADHPNLPVVIWSGFNEQDGQRMAREAGAADYLPKPVKMATLLDAVSRALD